jgi:hypothetical protein
MRYRSVLAKAFLTCALLLAVAPLASAQAPPASRPASIALEADAISYFIGGYSVIGTLTLRNRLLVALGTGRYELPAFLLEGDENYDTAEWEATSTSVQVLRVGYRFHGAMRNGPVLGLIALNQNFQLTSEPLAGSTEFRTLSVGLTGGYYFHIGSHFYIYPTVAFTYNSVLSGETSINGTSYTVEEFSPNGSVHVGWEWKR